MKIKFFAFVLVALAVPAYSQVNTVVPNQFASAATTGTFLGPLANGSRRYMLLVDAGQLTAHVGRNLSGIAWRNLPSATTAWPTAGVTYSSYEVKITPGVDPSARSLTFANNYAGTTTTVRTGALDIPAESYTVGGSPNAFGPTITFSAPYIYTGGDLVIEIVHTGFSGTSRSLEAVLATNGPAGVYGVQVSALWTATLTSATGSQGNACVFQLTSAPAAPTVTGTVTLQNSDADWSNENVTLQVVNAGTSTVAAFGSATLGASGAYTLSFNVLPGSYDLYFKGDTFLKKKVAGVNLVVGASTVNVTLKNGDVNGDNEVGASDFSVLASAYDTSTGDPNFSALADLNDDGEVGGADFSILSAAYDEVGDDF